MREREAESGVRLGTMPLSVLKKSGGFDAALRKFDWFYIGPEFCENLLDPMVCEEADELLSLGKKVCLLTPLVTEKGLTVLDRVFRRLSARARKNRARLEITVNDFGALELARARRLPFALSAGRLLFDNSFSGTRKMLKAHNLLALEFFRKLGVDRHEISATGLCRTTNFAPLRRRESLPFRLTLYYPYLNLTGTRTCPVGMADVRPEDGVRGVECGGECRISSFEVDHPAIKEKLVIRGNTVFLEFPRKFYASQYTLFRMGVDRLIYCPFP